MKLIRLTTLKMRKMKPEQKKPVRRLTAVKQEGNVITYRCLTCETEHEFAHTDPTGRPIGAEGMEFLGKWHNMERTGGAVTGYCPHCAKEYWKTHKPHGPGRPPKKGRQ